MRIYFVILHYQNYSITRKCVKYIKGLNCEEKCHIIVVDNASPNKTGNRLKKEFAKDKQVQVLLNEENLGFAKGNNIGYKLAKKEKADIIIVQNSDVIIEQFDFIEKLLNSDLLNDFHVIGPDILNLTMDHQNPLRNEKLSKRKIQRLLIYNIFLSAIYHSFFMGKLYIKIKDFFKKTSYVKSEEKLTLKKDVILHGACLIYTKKWIDIEDIAFLPITHMFFEEDILYEYILKKGYHTVYFPELKVLHEEDSSIDFCSKNNIEKRRYISANMRTSLCQLLKIKNQ